MNVAKLAFWVFALCLVQQTIAQTAQEFVAAVIDESERMFRMPEIYRRPATMNLDEWLYNDLIEQKVNIEKYLNFIAGKDLIGLPAIRSAINWRCVKHADTGDFCTTEDLKDRILALNSEIEERKPPSWFMRVFSGYILRR